jgi:hypothetical protein
MPSWVPMFSPWMLAAAGAGLLGSIVLLYFLKLKRQPVEVPSTYLWTKSIEDLHVNSIWQRLRQSLLLFLQLLLILLAFFALYRPTWNTTKRVQDRVIFLVDTSASMSATDVPPSRLDEARRRVLEEIDKLDANHVAMVISFSDSARVEQHFTDNKKLLIRAVQNIRQTNRTTNMKEALQVAAGLANPGRSATDISDTQVAEAMPAELKIYSDGGLERVEGFSLGNLEPDFVQIGDILYKDPGVPYPDKEEELAAYLEKRGPPVDWAKNVGIAAFSARRKEGRTDQLEVFGRLENYGPEEATAEVELYLNKELIDARKVDIPPGESAGVPFDLGEVDTAVLELRAKTADALAVDDVAWTAVNSPRRGKVLLVTPGNEPLEFVLSTERAVQLADVTVEQPGFLETAAYKEQAAAGAWGLVIFDRCAPKRAETAATAVMPLAHTLFIGSFPPLEGWKAEEKVNVPHIITTDSSHPLMNLLEMSNVIILEGTPLKPPPGSSVLIDTHVGPIFAIAPRDAYEDAVLGFELVGKDQVSTNWPLQPSFPVFWLNVLLYMGGVRDPLALGTIRPGQSVALQTETPTTTLNVRTPDGRLVRVSRGNLNAFNFTDTEHLGVYDVQDGKLQTIQRFAVNLFNPPESDIKPKDIQIGHTKVAGNREVEPARRDIWKQLLLLALAVLLFEWYIYNRRVYL